tara:strand:- start:1107 stop:1520 length:414 start_codon:yes stop_codon:yes gene_type:complete
MLFSRIIGEKMEIVKNSYVYWEFIRNLRNMDGVRDGFIKQNIISRSEHEQFMKRNSNFFWICLSNSVAIGYIGVIDNDIRIATHPDYQGLGVGSFMLNEVMKQNPQAQAKVKIGNKASLRLFEKNGFKKKYYLLEKQ